MITIYKTNTFKQACNYVNDVISRTDATNLDVNHFIIVPDRASLEAERALLCTTKGSFNVQVRTFKRLANVLLGRQTKDYLSKSAGVMMLSSLIAQHKDEHQFRCFTKGVQTAGFVQNMYDLICTLKYCRITPEKLTSACLPPRLATKIDDVAFLYRLYLENTRENYVDSADKMQLLAEAVCTSDVIKNSYFYLYDFDNFSKQELAVVEQLMLCAKGVTVACCYSNENSDRYLYLNDIYSAVTELCRKNNLPCTVLSETKHTSEFTKQIGKHLYRNGKILPLYNNGFVEVNCSSSRTQEVYDLACKIAGFVREGHRYKDVYVVCSDVEDYASSVQLVFGEFDIPYFVDKQFCLANHVYARFVTDYINAFANGLSLESVLPFVKNILFCGNDGVADNDVYLFENYCLKYNVSYDFSAFDIGTGDELYPNAESFRNKFYQLLCQINFPQQATAKDYVANIRQLVACCNLAQQTIAFAEVQKQHGYTYESNVSLQVAEKFELVLQQAESILGERLMSIDDFLQTLETAVATVNISVIPAQNDCVVFANMAKARKHDINFLALLGANYGAMPIVKREGYLLSDSDIAELVNNDINIEPKIATENKREKFSLYQLLQEPQKLYVSYTLSDGANNLLPSQFVDGLRTLFTENTPLPNAILPLCQKDNNLYTKQQAISQLVLAKRLVQDGVAVCMPCFDELDKMFDKQTSAYKFDENNARVNILQGKQLFFEKETMDASRVTEFYDCPYRYFLQYGLGVLPRKIAQLQSSDLGSILHAVLEKYVDTMQTDESDDETVKKANCFFDKVMQKDFYKGLLRDKTKQNVLKNLKKECTTLCKVIKKHFATSNFTNKATEWKFEKDDGVTVSFGNNQIKLVGKIDRIDTFGDYFTVVDYKSGSSGALFEDKLVYNGQKLQLLIYITAVQKAYGLQPAGYYYFNLHDKFTKPGDEGSYVYNGHTLYEKDVVFALDNTIETTGRSFRYNFAMDENGKSRSTSKLITATQIKNQQKYAIKMVEKMCEKLADGYCAISPTNGTCKFCNYRQICDFNDVYTYGERATITASAKNIDNAVNTENTTEETVNNA